MIFSPAHVSLKSNHKPEGIDGFYEIPEKAIKLIWDPEKPRCDDLGHKLATETEG
jgi:hypothetical protein